MKYWLTFVLGVVLGGVGGAFMASFLLSLDDAESPKYAHAKAASPADPAVAAKKPVPAQVAAPKPEVAAAKPVPQKGNPPVAVEVKPAAEAKPVGVSAEAVNLDDLPAATDSSLKTVKTEGTVDAPSTQ